MSKKIKYIWTFVVSASIVCASLSEPCQWDQYLGSPERTGYRTCNGPDSPEIFWEITLEGEIGNPLTAGDRIIVPCRRCISGCSFGSIPSYETTIVVIDLLTGIPLQEIVVEGSLRGVYPLGDLLLGESTNELYEIDIISEKVSLISGISGEFSSSCYPHCYPALLPDKIVFPTTPVICLSRVDYSILWDLQSSLESFYSENAETINIAASTDIVYVILRDEEDSKIWAVDSSTGTLIWVSNTLKASNIAVDGSILFAGGDALYALNAETGKLLWMFPCESGIHSNIVAGPFAVYFTDNKKLYAVDKNTGELKWESQWEGLSFWITDVIGAGNVIFCSNIFKLSSFSAEDGTLLWNVHFQNHIDHSPQKQCPVVANRILIVGGDEHSNRLIALASNPDLFVMRGDALLSQDVMDSAIDAYKKAAELYEKRGDLSRSQEMLEKIQELETQPESSSPVILPEPPTQIDLLAIISVVVLIGILSVYYLVKRLSRNQP